MNSNSVEFNFFVDDLLSSDIEFSQQELDLLLLQFLSDTTSNISEISFDKPHSFDQNLLAA